MNILIITQVVDTDHPGLGFFHLWITFFAKHCKQVTVICLEAGKYELPENVTVLSMGKEAGKGKWQYLFNFYKHSLSTRKDYDAVFVHMNQIYAILGWPIWSLLRKPVGLWYTHGTVSRTLKIAVRKVKYIFTASPESFRIDSPKVHVVGHGIDTAIFSPAQLPKDIDLITVGRITKSKNLIDLIDCVKELSQRHPTTLTIVGAAVTEAEQVYSEEIMQKIKTEGLEEIILLHGKVSQSDLPTLLSRSKIFVTMSTTGSLDKAVLEAMAVGLPVVSTASGTASLPLSDNQVANSVECAAALGRVLKSGHYYEQSNVDYVVEQHGLERLIVKILSVYAK